jgi:carbonic anhydrase
LVIGSLEYAVEHLGTRLIMVLGHQNCGTPRRRSYARRRR